MVLRKRSKLLPWRIAFWMALALAGALLLLDRRPLELDARDERAPASQPQQIDAASDFLVLRGERPLGETGAIDRSWAWVDMLQREVGPTAAALVGGLQPAALSGRRFVILTRSALADPAHVPHIPLLVAFAEAGGVLVLELPDGELRQRFAADGAGGWRVPAGITLTEGASETLADPLQRMPVLTRFRGSTRPAEGARTLVAMDGAPVVNTRTTGNGHVIVLEFDLGAQLTALQQGLPGPDGRVQPRQAGRPLHTSDLTAAPPLLGATQPFADLLQRYVVHGLLGAHAPVFALWQWPNGSPGALLSSHATHTLEGRPLWKSVHARQLDARTPTFALPPADPEARLPGVDAEFAGHAALLWAPDAREAALFRSHGFLGLNAVRRPLPFDEQLQRLRTYLGPGADVRGVRVIDGRWASDPTLPWEVFEAAGMRYSATFGPRPSGPQGFLFGTCHPFTPLDSLGRPFRLREVPTCFVDPASPEERDTMLEVLRASREEPRTVHILTRSDRFRTSPDMEAFDAWRDALRLAEREGLWIGGAGELVRFGQQRRGADLQVVSSEITQRFADGSPRVAVFQVDAATDARGLHLVIPERWGTWRFDNAHRGADQARSTVMADRVQTRTVQYGGNEVRLLAIHPGFTSITVRFVRSP